MRNHPIHVVALLAFSSTSVFAQSTPVVQRRPLLPADAWPLTLGRDQARQIVTDALEGRGKVVIPQDQPVYIGGGVVMRPRDAANTTITINWRMIQRELDAAEKAITPDEAVKLFKQDPANASKRFTVEFGIESAGWPDGPIREGEDPMPPVMADWDGRLAGGTKFSLILMPKAIRELKDVGTELPAAMPAPPVDLERLSVLCKHLKGKGVRVTGVLKAVRPGDRHSDYQIVVDDERDFQVLK